MKINRRQLRRIINEEYELQLLREGLFSQMESDIMDIIHQAEISKEPMTSPASVANLLFTDYHRQRTPYREIGVEALTVLVRDLMDSEEFESIKSGYADYYHDEEDEESSEEEEYSEEEYHSMHQSRNPAVNPDLKREFDVDCSSLG